MVICEVREWLDVFNVQTGVERLAADLGFSKRERTELAIVASELCSNILKYGISGRIELKRIEDDQGVGLAFIASDEGPPFRNFDAALQDGWDDQGPIDPLTMLKRKGIGGGLGAIKRFSHSLHVEPQASGKRMHVVRYLRRRI